MRLSLLLCLPAVLSVASALAVEKRDADFYSVRTKIGKDMSGRKGDPRGKYFHESTFHPHYDGRFAEKALGYRERKAALSSLMQTYLATFADIGVETWLMHGTLLGWWWNRKILPWDSDSDVQVSEGSMHYLASYYNMTVFHYKTPRIPEGRDYMLEINPHYVNREQTDKLNVIDARWVDTTSGLFIDITTTRYNLTHTAGEGMLSCKDGHEYRDIDIFPLRDTFFEGTPAKIPFAYKEVLEAEYAKKALTFTDYEGHHFDEEKLEWIPVKMPINLGAGMRNSVARERLGSAKKQKDMKGKANSPQAKLLANKKSEMSVPRSIPQVQETDPQARVGTDPPSANIRYKPPIMNQPPTKQAPVATNFNTTLPGRSVEEPASERCRLENAEEALASREEANGGRNKKAKDKRRAAHKKDARMAIKRAGAAKKSDAKRRRKAKEAAIAGA